MDSLGRGGGKADMATIDRIMLRFRPIAPRPEDAEPRGSSSGNWKLFGAGKKGMAVGRKYRVGRKKRKDATRVRKRNNLTGNINSKVITKRQTEFSFGNKPEIESVDRRLSSLPGVVRKGGGDRTDNIVDQDVSGSIVETWLTVERLIITEGMMTSASFGLGSLDDNTCPVFVTDERVEGVKWVNEAYKRMVLGAGAAEVRVGLGVKEGLQVPLVGSTASFTCWVRVECGGDTWRKEGRWSRTVPCDVWRMVGCGGGLAWRMDVKAALGLSLAL